MLGFWVGISYQSFEMANATHDLQLLYEAKEQEATKQGLRSIECPCNCCHGARQHQRITIKKHLWHNNRDPYFRWRMVVFIYFGFFCVLRFGFHVQEINLLANEDF